MRDDDQVRPIGGGDPVLGTDRLADRQLVRRTPSPTDRRRVEVRLAAKGEAIIRKLSAAHLAELREHGRELHRLLGSIIRA